MSLPRALSFVLKRVSKPESLSKDEIAKILADEESLKDMAGEVAALFDTKTGKVLATAAVRVKKMFAKHPALFSRLDVSSLFAEEEKAEAEPAKAEPAKAEGVVVPKNPSR